jgi:hypothetical protein
MFEIQVRDIQRVHEAVACQVLSIKSIEMGVTYQLVNRTQRECISFLHVPAAVKARELAGNPVSAAITTWYLLQNIGDEISFMSDTDGIWPFAQGQPDELADYRDVTNEVIQQLIEAGILRDEGVVQYFDDEPEIYDRLLVNVWEEML